VIYKHSDVSHPATSAAAAASNSTCKSQELHLKQEEMKRNRWINAKDEMSFTDDNNSVIVALSRKKKLRHRSKRQVREKEK
jgi:hypothetical protein